MNCWIILFHLCVFDPSSVYLTGDLSTQISGRWDQSTTHEGITRKTAGAFGRLELGIDVPLSRELVLRYGIEHISNVATGDRGEERAFIGFTWRPFR